MRFSLCSPTMMRSGLQSSVSARRSRAWRAEEIEALIEERQAAKKRRDFKRSDEIRKQLADSGIIVEDVKDGTVRWKYKNEKLQEIPTLAS